jgi:hypothetical protein
VVEDQVQQAQRHGEIVSRNTPHAAPLTASRSSRWEAVGGVVAQPATGLIPDPAPGTHRVTDAR